MTDEELNVLATELERAMLDDAEQAGTLGYNPTRFNMMVRREGGLAAAQKLLRLGPIPEGFWTLRQLGRLDLSLERLVLRPRWRPLFTDEEIEVARERLILAGYLPSRADEGGS